MKKNINTVDIGARFRKVIPNKNPFTPTIIQYQYAGDYMVELSHGEAMGGGELYGVTVVHTTKKEYRHDLSQCFATRKEARTHINTIAQL